jgi:hypothetical protein
MPRLINRWMITHPTKSLSMIIPQMMSPLMTTLLKTPISTTIHHGKSTWKTIRHRHEPEMSWVPAPAKHTHLGDTMGSGSTKSDIGGDHLGSGGVKNVYMGGNRNALIILAIVAIVALAAILLMVVNRPAGIVTTPNQSVHQPALPDSVPKNQNQTHAPGSQSSPIVVQEKLPVPASVPLSVQVNYVYRSGGTGPVRPIRNDDELRSGDHYKIFFTTSRDCYVYIFQIDAAGQIFRLFPLEQFDGVVLNHQNPVKGGSEVVLPTKDRFFYLDNIIGKEKIYFVASLQPDSALETLEYQMNTASRTSNTELINNARADMSAYLSTRGIGGINETHAIPVSWQSGDAASPVIGQILKNLGNGNVHTVEFFHR